jgi:hypothetical protein
MHTDQGEWILNEGEMASVAASFGVRSAGLGTVPERLPAPSEAEAAVQSFMAIEPPFRVLAERCLRALAGAKKVVHFHNSMADERASRCLLAWHPDMGGAWVSLARTGDLRRVSLRSEAELRYLVANSLAADDSLRADRISVNLSTPEALALLATFDHLRRARLISLLNHTEPVALFSAEDVQARLAEASLEDFRWTLPFLAKLLPLPVGDLAVTKDPRPALLALEKAGLLERLGTSGERVLCELTNAGAFLEAGFRESSAKAALSVTVPLQGGVGHDVFLLVRSVFDLFLVSLSGGDAALSTILAGDLDEILKAVFAPPPVLPEPEDIPAPQGVEATVIFGGPKVSPSRLVVESGPLAGKEFLLKDGLTLGRQDDNGIVVIDLGISRHHAKFIGDGKGGWAVQDLGSSNGTFVNETKVDGTAAMQPGTRVRVGETVLIFDPPVA